MTTSGPRPLVISWRRVFTAGVDEVRCSGAGGDLQLAVVDVDGDGLGAAESACGDGSKTDASAAEDRDEIPRDDAAARGGMRAYGEGLDEAKLLDGERGGIEAEARDGDVLGERTVALDAEGFIAAASVGAAAQATGAGAARGVWRQGYGCAGGKIIRSADYRCGDLVAQDARVLHHGIATAEGGEIGSAKTDAMNFEENFVWVGDGEIR
jgi:hypothetical protein